MFNKPEGKFGSRTQPKTALKLRSGGYLDLIDPDPDCIYLSDISIGLSRLCRYGGQTRDFYSVAQHSVLVSRLACQLENGDSRAAKWGLLHDASEAFLGDMVWPLKKNIPDLGVAYERIERTMMSAISDRFGLRRPPDHPGDGDLPWSVAYADRAVLLAEVRDLFGHGGFYDLVVERVGDCEPWPVNQITPLGPQQAHELFLTRAMEVGLD